MERIEGFLNELFIDVGGVVILENVLGPEVAALEDTAELLVRPLPVFQVESGAA